MSSHLDFKDLIGNPDEQFAAAVRKTLKALPEHKAAPRTRLRLAAAIAMAAILVAAAPFAVSFRRETYVYDHVEYAGAGSVDFYISDYFGNAEKLTIPPVVSLACGVSGIGENAFRNKKSLSEITIPDTVASIGNGAFFGCTNLISLTIRTFDSFGEPYAGNGGTALKTIGDSAFSGCAALTEMRAANSGSSEAASPAGCVSSVCIPDGVTYIGTRAFNGCAGITSVALPGTLLSIGDMAFAGCTGLTGAVIPDSVTHIGKDAFKNCASIILSVAEGSAAHRYAITNGIRYEVASGANTIYRSGAFDFILTHSGTAVITGFYTDGNVQTVSIPNSLKGYPVTGIGDKAFVWNPGLVQVIIPASVTRIGEAAFAGCSDLESVSLPASVTNIGKEAFAGCGSLKDMLMTTYVADIGTNAFKGCGLLMLTVEENSYPQRYAEENGIPYRIRPTWL
jgi:hypothetical protein